MVLQRTLTSPSAPFLRVTGICALPTDSFTKIPLFSNEIIPGSALTNFTWIGIVNHLVFMFEHFKLSLGYRPSSFKMVTSIIEIRPSTTYIFFVPTPPTKLNRT